MVEIERDFVKEVNVLIFQLWNDYDEADSEKQKSIILGKIEALKTIALPQAEMYNYILGEITSVLHKSEKK